MVIKVYVSGISGNKEVKKRQQRVLLILDSKNVNYEVIDIAEPGAEDEKDFMQTTATSMGSTISDPAPRHPLPPQIFNDTVYCGDYDQFDMANEMDEMEKFLKLQVTEATDNLISNAELKLKNGEVSPEEGEESGSTQNEIKENDNKIEKQASLSEEKSNEEEEEETKEKSKEAQETNEEPEADQDVNNETKATVDSNEDDEEEGDVAGGEQAESDQAEAVTKAEDDVVLQKDEEKADA